jgi:hypothetical protein
MRSLNSICQARDEARYISRSWSRESSAPDTSYPIQYTPKVESPDDIISVCRPDPRTLSGMGLVYMTRRQYKEEQSK